MMTWSLLTLLSDADPLANFQPWVALGANGILAGLCVWLITKMIPAEREKDRESRRSSEDAFLTELNNIRTEFFRQLAEDRKHYQSLVKENNASVSALSDSFHELAMSMFTVIGEGNRPILKKRPAEEMR